MTIFLFRLMFVLFELFCVMYPLVRWLTLFVISRGIEMLAIIIISLLLTRTKQKFIRCQLFKLQEFIYYVFQKALVRSTYSVIVSRPFGHDLVYQTRQT